MSAIDLTNKASAGECSGSVSLTFRGVPVLTLPVALTDQEVSFLQRLVRDWWEVTSETRQLSAMLDNAPAAPTVAAGDAQQAGKEMWTDLVSRLDASCGADRGQEQAGKASGGPFATVPVSELAALLRDAALLDGLDGLGVAYDLNARPKQALCEYLPGIREQVAAFLASLGRPV